MGPPFEDLNKMPIHAKALFAIFAARANNDGAGAAKLTMEIAASSAGGKMDFSGAMPLLRKHYNTKAIAQILGQHAYLYTMLPSILTLARTTGVLPPSDFLWLKPLDRRLWFMLNCTGRRTPYVEIAGPFSHWLAEKALKRKITQPMVDGAIKGLEEAIKMIIYTRDED
jgi:intracellular multiplication protein IcmP